MQAVKGQGIDRHLLGLKLIALENNMKVPALHMDVAYSLSSHHNVSTSQVTNPFNDELLVPSNENLMKNSLNVDCLKL